MTVRQSMRALRRNLTLPQRALCHSAIDRRVLESAVFKQAKSLATYITHEGEVDPAGIVVRALQQGKACYLPVVQDTRQLLFRRFLPEHPLVANRWGLLEPDASMALIASQDLDLVLVPLVAFDACANRMGRGGGYYDRSFAFCLQPGVSKKPFLMGLAYSFQQVATCPVQPWDVPLDQVVTEESC